MVFKFYKLQINSRPLKCHLVFVAHNVFNLVTSSGSHIKLDLVYEVLFPSKVSKISQKFLPAAAVIGAFVDLLCFFCLVFAMPLYVSVYMCLVVTCWERADLLAVVCGV